MADMLLLSVIDDDGPIRRALKRLLVSEQHKAFLFDSAESFLASQQACNSSCIITDVQLPGLSGFELIGALTARGIRTPVIMITARADADLEQRASITGALCLLRKPFRADRLLTEVAKALTRQL